MENIVNSATGLLSQISQIQARMRELAIDGWLLYDFRESNSPMKAVLDLQIERRLTRRLFFWIPASGEPTLLRHQVDGAALHAFETFHRGACQVAIFQSREQLASQLSLLLNGASRVAMEFSPCAALPYISCVDAGTVQLIESLGVQVISSADLLGELLARWDQRGLDSHLRAARALDEETLAIMAWIHAQLQKGATLSEWQVASKLKESLESRGMYLDHMPIIAVDANSADAHYTPCPSSSRQLLPNQVLLIDVWCRENAPQARYADICRMAVLKAAPSAKQNQVFQAVLEAQTAAITFIKSSLFKGDRVRGFEPDKIARQRVNQAGWGPFFTHRLGHSIDFCDHGHGTHLDDFETHDERELMTRSCCSVEPGIYLPGEFGVRLESNLYIDTQRLAHVTGGHQTHWYCLSIDSPLYLPAASSPQHLAL